MDTMANHCRNAIYIIASGLQSTDAFRLELKVTYEYVPTTAFKLWANPDGVRSNLHDQ